MNKKNRNHIVYVETVDTFRIKRVICNVNKMLTVSDNLHILNFWRKFVLRKRGQFTFLLKYQETGPTCSNRGNTVHIHPRWENDTKVITLKTINYEQDIIFFEKCRRFC